MTNKPNSGTVSVSRELLGKLVDADFSVKGQGMPNHFLPMIEELRATLAQPADQQGEPVRERFQKWVLSIEHPVKGWLDGHWLKRGDDGEGYADEYVQGLWVAFKALGVQQGEPVAVECEDGSVLTKSDCIDDEVFAICCKGATPLYRHPQPATAKVGGEVLEKLKELVSAVRSINRSPKHEIRVIGDDKPCYAQRKEWVEWLLSICDDADEVANLNGATKVVLPDCMNFTYEHRDNKERHTVSVSHVGSVGKYDEVLKPFMGMMEKELHANSGKGDRPGWLSMSADTCMLEIYYHLGKLQKAVKDGNGDGICEFAADVANLSMMLTDICGALNLFAAAQPADQQGEPVCDLCNGTRRLREPGFDEGDCTACLLAQPATAKVVLPRRLSQDDGFSYEAAEWFNACLDEVAKLNGINT